MRFHWSLIAAALAMANAEERVSYDGYKVFSIDTTSGWDKIRQQLSSIETVSMTLNDVDGHFDVAVAPHDLEAFESLGLDFQVVSEDLGADFAEESQFEEYHSVSGSSQKRQQVTALPDLSWFNSYHSYADHRTFFDDLKSAFPQNSEIFSAGNSYEGRDIYGIHFWGAGGKGQKPAVYLHATVHAREWAAAPVEEYITWQLINGYLTGDATVKALVDKYDFYVIPFANPDGFVYTQGPNRLWRKNRQPRSSSTCIGTDNNRNWPFKWNSNSQGASTYPCDEDYKGQAEGDTPEIKSLVAFTKSLTKGIKLFIDFHSYGQYILQPYGYTCSSYPANIAQQRTAATQMASRISQFSGARYTTGSSCGALYPTTGDSTDYLTGASGAEYAWTIELPPSGSSGTSGFVLPASRILPVSKENWEGFKTLLSNI